MGDDKALQLLDLPPGFHPSLIKLLYSVPEPIFAFVVPDSQEVPGLPAIITPTPNCLLELVAQVIGEVPGLHAVLSHLKDELANA